MKTKNKTCNKAIVSTKYYESYKDCEDVIDEEMDVETRLLVNRSARTPPVFIDDDDEFDQQLTRN